MLTQFLLIQLENDENFPGAHLQKIIFIVPIMLLGICAFCSLCDEKSFIVVITRTKIVLLPFMKHVNCN